MLTRSHSVPASPKSQSRPARKLDLTAVPTSPGRLLRKHDYHAILGSEKREGAKRVVLSDDGALITQTAHASCPVHSYKTVTPLGDAVIGSASFGRTTRGVLAPTRVPCPVHAYTSPRTTLRSASASIGRCEAPRHLASTNGRTKVHSYGVPTSTLLKTGAVPFGSTAPRAGNAFHSRTGLLTAAPTPKLRPAIRA